MFLEFKAICVYLSVTFSNLKDKIADLMCLRKRKLEKALAALGTTEEDVYLTLLGLNIKGQKGKMRHCPIAQYIKWFTKRDASVSYLGIILYNNRNRPIPDQKVALPSYVESFMRNFDAGKKYFDLVG